jgi:hypothetical protein
MGLETGNIYQHELSAESKVLLQEFYEGGGGQMIHIHVDGHF